MSAVRTTTALWGTVLALTWVQRASGLEETRSTAGVMVDGSIPMATWLPLSPTAAWGLWAVTVVGAVGAVILTMFASGRARWVLRACVLGATMGALVLNLEEGLNLRAYDRLLGWEGLALLLATGTGVGSDEDPRTSAGFARYFLLVVYAGLYGSTGWLKMLLEPGWERGGTLANFLVDTSFGLRPFGTWVSANPALLSPAGWMTVAFETSFPFLVWFRPTRRALLPVGFLMHAGIFALMNVGPFSLVAVAGYPLLLGERDWQELSAMIERRRLVWPIAGAVATWGALIAVPLASPLLIPRHDAPFQPSDPAIRAAIVAALRSPTPLPGPEHAPMLTAPLNPKTAGERAAVAVLTVFAALRPDVDVGLSDETHPHCVRLASLGRMSVVPGTQRWPGLWVWILPTEGDFLTGRMTAPDDTDLVYACLIQGGVPFVDTSRVFSDGERYTLTDTGSYRSPARDPAHTDDIDLLDLDSLARVVKALECYTAPHQM